MIYKRNIITKWAVVFTVLFLSLVIMLSGCDKGTDDKNENTPGENTGNTPTDDPSDDPVDDPNGDPNPDPDSEPNPEPEPDPEPDEPRVMNGYMSVRTTNTYSYRDKYSFTVPMTGTYTFTIPEGLGFISDGALRPELDFQLSSKGGEVVLDLEEGKVLNFSIGSHTVADWVIYWKGVEGEIEPVIEPTYDVYIEANDPDGYSFTYTATQTGNLTVTVTDFAYDWMGGGRYIVAGKDAFETGFPRMYALVLNGTSFSSHIATIPVTAGDEVTIQLYCHYGYATKANIDTTISTGTGGNSGTNYPADSSYDLTLEAGDTDGKSFTYTATVAGNLVISVPYLAYDYKGEGEFHVADADTLNNGFSKMYALVINGQNVGAYTETIAVKAGDKVSVQLYCHRGYATNATVTVAYASGGSGSSTGNVPSGTETNPIILGSFPSSITFNSDAKKFIYYKITAQESGMLTLSWPTADSWYNITELNPDGTNTPNNASGYSTQTVTFEVKAGTQYLLCLGSWSTVGSLTVAISISKG